MLSNHETIRPFGKRQEGYGYVQTEDGDSEYKYYMEYYLRKRTNKGIYIALLLIAIAAFGYAGFSKTESNLSVLTGAAQGFAFVFLTWLIYCIVCNISAGKKITIGKLRIAHVQLQWASGSAAVCLLTASVATFAVSASGGTLGIKAVICGIMFFISFIAILGIFLTEKMTYYTVEFPEDGCSATE